MPLASPPTTHHMADPPSNRTPLAVAALVFGVLTVGIALAVAFVGVFLPYAWYAVVALAALTLVCGLLSVSRKHHTSSTGGIMAWMGVVAGVVALVLGVWGLTNVLRGGHQIDTAGSPVQVLHDPSAAQTAAPPAAPTTPALDGPQLAIGQTYMVGNVKVRITGPNDYTPSAVAATSDGTAIDRAVKFTATITDNSNAPLLANAVEIDGIVNGDAVGHVTDTTVLGLTQDIQPGQTVTFTIGFNVPKAPTRLIIKVNPQSMNSTDKVYYVGTV
jgi:hypothetical protein